MGVPRLSGGVGAEQLIPVDRATGQMEGIQHRREGGQVAGSGGRSRGPASQDAPEPGGTQRPCGVRRSLGTRAQEQTGAGLPRGDEADGVPQAQCARDVRGRELADAVARHGAEFHAPGLPEPEERDLVGEQGDSAVARLFQEDGVDASFGCEHDRHQGNRRRSVDHVAQCVEGGAERGEGPVQRTRAGECLAVPVGEQHSQLPGGPGTGAGCGLRGAVARHQQRLRGGRMMDHAGPPPSCSRHSTRIAVSA